MVEKPAIKLKGGQQNYSLRRNHAQHNSDENKVRKLKKKVQLNTNVQFMDDGSSCEIATIGSPDLDILNDDNCDNNNSDNDTSDQDSDGTDDTDSDGGGSDYEDKDDSSDDGEAEDMNLVEDDFGPLQYRDPNDKQFLLGFELRHFELDDDSGLDNINLRHEENTDDDTNLNDNLAFSLVNALLNSSDKTDKRKGKQLLKKLKFNAPRTMKMTSTSPKPAPKIEPKTMKATSKSRKPTPKTKSAPRTKYQMKVTSKSWQPIQMGPTRPKKSAGKTSMTSRQAGQAEKLNQLIASTVNGLDMNTV